MLVRLFNGDQALAAQLRARLVGRGMVRRDAAGQVIADLRVTGDKGNPPRDHTDPSPVPTPPPERTPEEVEARRQAAIDRAEAEIRGGGS